MNDRTTVDRKRVSEFLDDVLQATTGSLHSLNIAPILIEMRKDIGEPLIYKGEKLPHFMYGGRYDDKDSVLAKLVSFLPKGAEAEQDLYPDDISTAKLVHNISGSMIAYGPKFETQEDGATIFRMEGEKINVVSEYQQHYRAGLELHATEGKIYPKEYLRFTDEAHGHTETQNRGTAPDYLHSVLRHHLEYLHRAAKNEIPQSRLQPVNKRVHLAHE